MNDSCSNQQKTEQTASADHCDSGKRRFDYLLWVSVTGVVIFYALQILLPDATTENTWYTTFAASVFELINTVWWGVLLGMLMVAILAKVPREFVISILGSNKGLSGVLRATLAGVLLDLCSHGILMVGTKLYERGASAGQVMAFLIASPWNSFSLTLILIALIGIGWTAAFIILSMIIAIIVGLLFELLVKKGTLPGNPQSIDLPANFNFWHEAKSGMRSTVYDANFFRSMISDGISGSRMVVKWLLFGVLLASAIRAFVSMEDFSNWFGPSLLGLGMTLIAATIIEVCSEGSTPIAADLLNNAKAPGNGFAFLMTGVATDYTEIMVLRETTRSWRLPLFLPLLTVPQVIVIGWLLNQFSA
jgi:hypothetical protein